MNVNVIQSSVYDRLRQLLTILAVHRIAGQKERIWAHVLGLSFLLGIFALCYAGLRWHYGISPHHTALWTYRGNFNNIFSITSPANELYIGGGLLLAYLTTFARGTKEYLPFILGYAVPLFLVAAFFSNFEEHRVFHPLMVLLAAAMVRYSAIPPLAAQTQKSGSGEG